MSNTVQYNSVWKVLSKIVCSEWTNGYMMSLYRVEGGWRVPGQIQVTTGLDIKRLI